MIFNSIISLSSTGSSMKSGIASSLVSDSYGDNDIAALVKREPTNWSKPTPKHHQKPHKKHWGC
ncbi:hypothetical protein DICPUDRAFT_157093 [Dictyostelium purpureum]|uniref:Uncharacterized protein n=1 Tax=Dictyostelium purpureum TaxID=5786 RepID=F0ZY87_DICPU|nr:uncharacterized protein DICPUDRAFT_157093 [Dictyostelium purpureum]EGC31100.1 hypothetical protein DICPUDRAFT_157093 [Dictyostelium purpureum]|eukprot:XP_003292377.1 hypothetical protein DICPUDRAFT_157093 [Dictyostelium purpureum]